MRAQNPDVIVSALRAFQHWVWVRGDSAPSHLEQLGRPQLRRLPAGAVVGFDMQGRARVTCLGGELWVTGPGTDDQILSSGQSLTVYGSGRVVAEALRDARLVVAR